MTDLSHGVPAPDGRGPVLERPHRLLAREQVVGPVRRPLEVGGRGPPQRVLAALEHQVERAVVGLLQAHGLGLVVVLHRLSLQRDSHFALVIDELG